MHLEIVVVASIVIQCRVTEASIPAHVSTKKYVWIKNGIVLNTLIQLKYLLSSTVFGSSKRRNIQIAIINHTRTEMTKFAHFESGHFLKRKLLWKL